jgi:hypothetical protein
MPPTRRRSSSIVRSAATKIQKRVRGKQTRKKTKDLKIAKRNLEISNECAICLDKVLATDAITSLECGHRFHRDCMQLSLRSGHANCPLCRRVIVNNEYAHLANPNMTYVEALVARSRALEERRLATQALTNAASHTMNYEQSNRIRRLLGINSPTYINFLQTQENAGEELRRTRERVTNSMNTIRRLSGLHD